MHRIAFKLKLFRGYEEEYKKRHNEIWPELQALLKESGIREYLIFLDPETNNLLGIYKVIDPITLIDLPEQPIMQKWWQYMGDMMETNPDSSPVSTLLPEVF